MLWTKDKIRELRLRMGWSQSDLARRMNCECCVVIAWEDGSLAPEFHHQSFFSIIANHAESQSQEVHTAPVVESFLDETQLGQINRLELGDKNQ